MFKIERTYIVSYINNFPDGYSFNHQTICLYSKPEGASGFLAELLKNDQNSIEGKVCIISVILLNTRLVWG